MRYAPYMLVIALLVAGCELFDTRDETTGDIDYGEIRTIRFSEHVQPLLAQKCTSCHAGADAAAGLHLDSWAHAIAGSDFGEAFIPFDAENSLLVELATKVDPPHPIDVGGDTLAQAEIDFLARWIREGAQNDAGEVPYADSEQRLYVANQDAATISVIDMEANVVMRTVKLGDVGFADAPRPHHIVVEPDGSFWYVSLIGANAVLKFNRANELVGQTEAFETPGMLALHPTEDWLYAGRSLTAQTPPTSIGVIRRSDMSLEEEVGVFFERPHALRVSPDGAYVYTASLNTNQMAAIHTTTHDVDLAGVPGTQPQAFIHMAIAPDGQTMYITGQISGQLKILDLADPTDPVLVNTLDVNPAPWHPVLTPDGRGLYFGNKQANTITVVDTQTQAVADVIAGLGVAEPHGAAVRADGRYVYISNQNSRGVYAPRYDLGDNASTGTVVVIDTATNEIVKVLEVEELPAGMDSRRE